MRQAIRDTGRTKLVVSESLLVPACHSFVGFLVGNLVGLHVPGVRRLVVGCPAAKAEK